MQQIASRVHVYRDLWHRAARKVRVVLRRATSQVAPNSRGEASTDGKGSRAVREQRRNFLYPSVLGNQIASAFVGALAHFLFPPSPTTERQCVRVVFVIFAAFICALIAQLALCRRCRRIGIIPARLTRLCSSVGSLAGGGKCNNEATQEKAAEKSSHGASFPRYRAPLQPSPQRCRADDAKASHTHGTCQLSPQVLLAVFCRFDLFRGHPNRRSFFPPLEFLGRDESLCRLAPELPGHRRLQSRHTIALRGWKLGGALRCRLPRLRAGKRGAGDGAADQRGQCKRSRVRRHGRVSRIDGLSFPR